MRECVHRFQCAAITNGCDSVLMFKENRHNTLNKDEFLTVNGWWQDHGEWVCGKHEPKVKDVK